LPLTARKTDLKGECALKIEHLKGRRFFALYDDSDELIAVFVYRKGAQTVKERLEQSQQQKEDHNAASNRVARAGTARLP
jgi:hypothetical protein